ncbi:heme exporter protein CcmB [Pendulispora rubella]|uniref:Heme exporter protein B n=1 Tax=Pendulispora rubella TaxID=2741070 RepID=A0ABZ2KZL1_9BACT
MKGQDQIRDTPSLLPSPVQAAWLVAAKDLRIELRTREIVTTAGFFATLVAIMTSVAFQSGAETTRRIAPGAVWLSVAFSSVLALGRTWQREREDGALIGLLVTPIARASLFLGKAIGVFAFVLAVEVIVVPVVALLFHIDLPDVIGPLSVVLALGTLGVAATGTLFGAMTVRTRARDLVLATVLFPLLSPTLVSGVAATRDILTGLPLSEITDYLILLGAFDVLALLGGLTLFGALIDE